MARSLFDASRIAGPPDPSPRGPGDGAWTVSRLAQRIDDALSSGLPKRLRVIGEVSTPNHRTHWYFNLKDDDAVISAVLFASDARRSPVTPEHGTRVIATGRVQHYAKQGRTQFYVEKLEAAGKGKLEEQLKRLIDELRAEGYFDDEHKRPLPAFPRRIAVVTSRTGAALQDVIDTARRRCPAVELLVVDTRVQGDDAGPRIAAIIDALSHRADELAIDALLITRGGGSLEDLWCFNDRSLADAIWDCAVPVVCAIGHETDTTVCELVADRRCATPTQAAMVLTPDTPALLEQLDMTARTLASGVQRLRQTATALYDSSLRRLASLKPVGIQEQRLLRRVEDLSRHTARTITAQHLRLERLAARLLAHRPESVHTERLDTVARAERRLARAVRARLNPSPVEQARRALTAARRRALAEHQRTVDALERELILVSPASVLSRGYSLTTREDTGTLVRTPEDVSPGVPLVTRVEGGTLRSRVEGKSVSDRAAPSADLPPRRRARTRRNDPDQMGLF